MLYTQMLSTYFQTRTNSAGPAGYPQQTATQANTAPNSTGSNGYTDFFQVQNTSLFQSLGSIKPGGVTATSNYSALPTTQTAGTGATGSSSSNPYVLNISKKGGGKGTVPFDKTNAPQFLTMPSESNSVYQLSKPSLRGGRKGQHVTYTRIGNGPGPRTINIKFQRQPQSAGNGNTTTTPAHTTPYGGTTTPPVTTTNPGYPADPSCYCPPPPPVCPPPQQQPPVQNPVKVTTISPLVMDLNGDGIQTTEANRSFDIDGDGKQDRISSVGKDDGTLVFDADGNGIAGESGKELFGNVSDVDGDGKSDGFANGFEALTSFANKFLGQQATQDGVLDKNELAQLGEKSGIRLDVAGQQRKLSELGIDRIDLGFQNSDHVDAFGNEFRQRGTFSINGQSREIVDLWYAAHQA